MVVAAYSELVFVPIHWPDFDKAALPIAEYARRERRFGGLGWPRKPIVTEDRVGEAAASERCLRNLDAGSVAAALVLAPVAIAKACAGGLWDCARDAGRHRSLRGMADDRGPRARDARRGLRSRRACRGGTLPLAGRVDASLAVLAIGLIATVLISPERRTGRRRIFYAGAAQVAFGAGAAGFRKADSSR